MNLSHKGGEALSKEDEVGGPLLHPFEHERVGRGLLEGSREGGNPSLRSSERKFFEGIYPQDPLFAYANKNGRAVLRALREPSRAGKKE